MSEFKKLQNRLEDELVGVSEPFVGERIFHFWNPALNVCTDVIKTKLPDALARNSRDGSAIYIDELVPDEFVLPIIAREVVFYPLVYTFGANYKWAEQVAIAQERVVADVAGIDWEDYQDTCKEVLAQIVARDPRPESPEDVLDYEKSANMNEATASGPQFSLMVNPVGEYTQVIMVMTLTNSNLDFIEWALSVFKKKGLVMNTQPTPFDLPDIPGKQPDLKS